MNSLIKNFLVTLAAGIIAVAGVLSSGLFDISSRMSGAISPVNPQQTQASTTVFALTTASQRLLATTSRRVAAQIDVTKCTGGAAGAYVRMGLDKPATTATGSLTFASTSEAFGLTPFAAPIVTGAVTGITDTGTCTVIVTEWIDGN